MSKKVFELNYAGVGELLRSKEMGSVLSEYAGQVVSRAGTGYGYKLGQTGQRAKATVFTASHAAIRDNSENNSLLKALGGGQ